MGEHEELGVGLVDALPPPLPQRRRPRCRRERGGGGEGDREDKVPATLLIVPVI